MTYLRGLQPSTDFGSAAFDRRNGAEDEAPNLQRQIGGCSTEYEEASQLLTMFKRGNESKTSLELLLQEVEDVEAHREYVE